MLLLRCVIDTVCMHMQCDTRVDSVCENYRMKVSLEFSSSTNKDQEDFEIELKKIDKNVKKIRTLAFESYNTNLIKILLI